MQQLNEKLKIFRKLLNDYLQNYELAKFNEKNKKSGRFKNYSDHIIISGEPRGGTTWLMELLMQKSDCLVWEPLHKTYLKKYSPNFFNEIGYLPYIPEDANWDKGKDFFSQLLKGQLPYGLQVNSLYGNSISSSNRLLIKFCRANMILPWITEQFGGIKTLYIVRNPLSVISSQFRHPAFNNINLSYNLFKIRENGNPLYSEIFKKHNDKIEKIHNRETLFANWWSIQNLLPLKHLNKRWLTISYESLYLNPQSELKRISNYLDISTAYSHEKILKPSSTTKSGSGILEGQNQLSNYKRHLSKTQIKQILDVVNSYEINCYTDDLEPEYDLLSY